MSLVTTILTWPKLAVENALAGSYTALVVGGGVFYWWAGGLPTQGQDMMTLAQAYVIAGGAVAATGMAGPGGAAM